MLRVEFLAFPPQLSEGGMGVRWRRGKTWRAGGRADE